MKKKLKLDSQQVKEAILSGLKRLKDAVAPTLGPLGKLVLLDRLTMFPQATKDGATVAREIESEDKLEDLAIRVCREISMRTEEEAGDGTTTSIILAEALVRKGFELIGNGNIHYHHFKRQLERSLKIVLESLEHHSKKHLSDADIKSIIRVSSNYDEDLVNLISKAIEKTNRHGALLIEEARGLETSVDIVQGFSYDKGPLSPYFYTNPQKELTEYADSAVLMIKGRLDVSEKLIKVLGYCGANNLPLLVVADEISPEALTMLVINKVQGGLKFVATQLPYHGDRHWSIFDDLAAVTGGQILDSHSLSLLEPESLGRAKRIVLSKKRTVVVAHEDRDIYIEQQCQLIGERGQKETSSFMLAHLKERLGRLRGGVAVLRIGAPTELEMREKKDRAADAYLAARSAIESGSSIGGGYSYYREHLDITRHNMVPGDEALGKALIAPLEQLRINAGMDERFLIELASKGKVFNMRTSLSEKISETEVLDSTKVLMSALENAVSIATILLNVGSAVVYEGEEAIRKELESDD